MQAKMKINRFLDYKAAPKINFNNLKDRMMKVFKVNKMELIIKCLKN